MILLAIATAFIIYIIVFVLKKSSIQRRWRDVFRHIVAILVGWIAFGVLSSLLVLLDLFEASRFTFTDFANELLIPVIIFIVGMVLLSISLISPDK